MLQLLLKPSNDFTSAPEFPILPIALRGRALRTPHTTQPRGLDVAPASVDPQVTVSAAADYWAAFLGGLVSAVALVRLIWNFSAYVQTVEDRFKLIDQKLDDSFTRVDEKLSAIKEDTKHCVNCPGRDRILSNLS